MRNPLRTALVGIGKVTDLHAKALAALPESDFRAVCSRSMDKASAYAKRFGVKPYTDVSAMVEMEKIDVVLILTPHPNHRQNLDCDRQSGEHIPPLNGLDFPSENLWSPGLCH